MVVLNTECSLLVLLLLIHAFLLGVYFVLTYQNHVIIACVLSLQKCFILELQNNFILISFRMFLFSFLSEFYYIRDFVFIFLEKVTLIMVQFHDHL